MEHGERDYKEQTYQLWPVQEESCGIALQQPCMKEHKSHITNYYSGTSLIQCSDYWAGAYSN